MPAYTAGKIEPPKEFFVPAGTWKLRVVEAKDDTDDKGQDITDVTFRVIMGDGHEGPKFRERFWFTAKAAWKFDHFLMSCGQYPGEGAPVTLPATELVGWACEARLKVRTFKGSKGDDIKTNEIETFLFDDFS